MVRYQHYNENSDTCWQSCRAAVPPQATAMLNVLPDDEEEALCVIYSINVLTTKC